MLYHGTICEGAERRPHGHRMAHSCLFLQDPRFEGGNTDILYFSSWALENKIFLANQDLKFFCDRGDILFNTSYIHIYTILCIAIIML